MKNKRKFIIGSTHIKKLFQRWLSLFIIIGFVIMLGGAWKIYSHISKKAADDMLRIQLRYACEQIDQTQKNLEIVTQQSNHLALLKVRSFSRIIEADPTIVKKPDELGKIKQILEVDELHVSNEKGILIASFPEEKQYINYDMASQAQSAAFIPALSDKSFALVQEPQQNGANVSIFQYAGIARRDRPGIIQIGYRPERIKEAQKIADINFIAKGFRIGRSGSLAIQKASDLNLFLSPGEELFRYKKDGNGVDCITLTIAHHGYLLTGTLPSSEIYIPRDSVIQVLVIADFIFFLTIFLLVTILLQRIVISGINEINASLFRITQGNLDECVKVDSTKEFQELSTGINSMVKSLKNAIAREKQRLDSELELGKTIQMSVLPDTAMETKDVILSAGMFAAREIGGDFYDFFWLNENQIALVIADVSGKGLTAALFMMNAEAKLKELLLSGMDLPQAVTKANREFCMNNKVWMFLTAFIAIIDISKQTITCVNAGHNPQLIRRNGCPWEYLHLQPACPLAVKQGYKFRSEEMPFHPGDRIFLYTDGVTEAQNHGKKLFGTQRLQDILNENSDCTPAETLKVVQDRIYLFAEDEPQSDDITMLAFEFKKQR